MGNTVYVLAAIAIGASLSLQPPINAAMARGLGGPLLAACVSIAISLVLAVAVWLLVGRAQGDLSKLTNLPWWSVIGGAVGVAFVAGSVLVAPPLGLAWFFVCVVAGQLVASTLVDHFGLFRMFGLEAKPMTLLKGLGVALVLVGAALVRSGDAS